MKLKAVDMLGLIVAGAVAVAGWVATLVVVRMGLLAPAASMGHDADYVAGWRLFFLLMLGLPSFAVAILGTVVAWRLGKRIRRRLPASDTPGES